MASALTMTSEKPNLSSSQQQIKLCYMYILTNVEAQTLV